MSSGENESKLTQVLFGLLPAALRFIVLIKVTNPKFNCYSDCCHRVSFVLLVDYSFVKKDMAVFLTDTFRVKNKKSGLYLSVAGYSKEPSATLEQEPMQPLGDNVRTSQIWYVFPVNDDRHLAVNMRSFLFMNVVGNSTAAGASVEQYVMQSNTPNATQSWVINPVSDYLTIQNAVSHLYLNVKAYSTENAAAIEQWSLQESSPDRDSQLWTFEVEELIPYVPPEEVSFLENDVEGVIPERTFTPREIGLKKTEELLLGEVVIPFPLVDDEARSHYYVLRRYGRWNLVHHHIHDGLVETTFPCNIKLGLISGNEEEVKRLLGISVRPDASLEFSNAMSLYSQIVSKKLNLGERKCTDISDDWFEKFTIVYLTDVVVTDTIWYREDRYELLRMDGTEVVKWNTRYSESRFFERSAKATGRLGWIC